MDASKRRTTRPRAKAVAAAEDFAPDAPEAATTAGDKPEPARAPYTAVIYVHGIGSQRRYEETSRLVDRIDQHLKREHQRGNSIGLVGKIQPRLEPLRPDGENDTIGYIRTIYSTDPKWRDARSVRFYEIYWAPVMAGASSVAGVVRWIFSQPLRPFRTLRSPWRERQRLRRSALVALFERGGRRPPGAEDGDYTALMTLYNDFEGPNALRDYPKGTFEEFLAFVARKTRSPDAAQRRTRLAKAWRDAYVGEELRNAFLLATMALALVLLAFGAVAGLLQALQMLTGFGPLASLMATLGVSPQVDWRTAATIAVSLAGLFGLSRLLTEYLGDVEAWATYEETNVKYAARQKVLEQSLQVLTHVLTDPACERVAIVAHSLGTSIAHDALLALTRRNWAFNVQDRMSGPVPLRKIEHFITLGSPIDKIEYFFESYASPTHRYKRVVEALRGDIGRAPFTDNRKPHIHWINFWDEGDVISGALHSPASGAEFCQHVDNYHVNGFHFPAPGASHSAYFQNKAVIHTIFQAIYQRGHSFKTVPRPEPGQPPDYAAALVGPGERRGARRIYSAIMCAIPWVVLGGLIGWVLRASWVAQAAAGLVGVSVVGLVCAFLVSRMKGPLNPI